MARADAERARTPEHRVHRRRLVRITGAALAAVLTWTLAPFDTPVSAAGPISSDVATPPESTAASTVADPPSELAVDSIDPPAPHVDAESVGEDSVALSAATAAVPDIVPLQPARALETRRGERTEDGRSQLGRRLAAGSTTEIPIAGRVGVDGDAAAVVVYVTVIDPSDRGFVTLFPCRDQPLASSLNYPAPPPGGRTVIGNEVVAKLSTAGSLCVFTRSETDMTFDVVGFVPAASRYVPIEPARLLETRPGEVTEDRQFEGSGPVGPGDFIKVKIAGRQSIPVDAAAAVVNVTAINPDDRGFVTMYPCGDLPVASSLNYLAGDVVGNEVIAKLDATGSVCAFSRARTNLAFDVVGYIPTDAGYVSLRPARLLETRPGERTADRRNELGRPLAAGTTTEVQISDRGGVPADATAAVINVSAINPVLRGFFTVFPCGDRPVTSSLNYPPGRVLGNEIVAKLSDRGTVCIFTLRDTHAAFDVVGAVVPRDAEPPVELRFEPGWRLEPSSVSFEQDGEQALVRLVHYGTDGLPSGRSVPDTAEIQFSNTTFRSEPVEGGFMVYGDDRIGSTMVIAQLPDGSNPQMWVTSSRLADGVVGLDDDQVVLPPPPGASATSLGPFTAGEFDARSVVDVDAGVTRTAVVLSGTLPPTGTIVVASGEAGVGGRIIEPPGLPTIVRDGLSLVTLELVPLADMYSALDVSADFEELTATGFLDGGERSFCVGAGCTSDGSGLFAVDRAKPVSSPVTNSSFFDKCIKPDQDGRSATFGEAKFVFELNASPTGSFAALIAPAVDSARIDFAFGFDVSLKAGFEGKVQAGLGVSIDCDLKEFSDLTFRFPGALMPILSGVISPKIVGSLGASVSGGPKVDFKATREIKYSFAGGYRYLPSGEVEEIIFDNKPTITDDISVTPDAGGTTAGSFGVPAEVSLSGGIFLAADLGVRLGGQTAEWLGQVLNKEDFGLIQPVTAKIGPQLTVKWEREASVVEAKKAGSEVSAAIVGDVTFSLAKFTGLLKILAKGIPGSLEPTFAFGIGKVVLAAPAELSGSPKVTVLNEETDVLDIDDVVDVEFEFTQPANALTTTSLEGDVNLYEVNGSGANREYTESDLLRWSVRPTSLTGSFTVDADDCNDFGADGQQYIVIAMQEALGGIFEFPGWAGEFTLTCDRSLEIEPDSIQLRRDAPTTQIEIRQKGLDDEPYSFVLDDDPLPDGFGIDFIQPGARLEAETTPVDVRLTCPDDVDDVDGVETVVYELRTENSSETAKLTIEANCTNDYFEIVEDIVFAPGSINFRSEGIEDDFWTAGSPISPTGGPEEGFLRGTESASERASVLSASVSDTRVPPPLPPSGCQGGSPGFGPLPEERTTATVSTVNRGSDTVVVVLPAREGKPPVPGEPCPPPPPSPPGGPAGDGGTGSSPGSGSPGGGGGGSSSGGGHGDPHIFSFDGIEYGAMTLGEYIYAEPLPGVPDGPRVVARHEFTLVGAALRPTSITAVAVEVDGRTIEVYGREATELRIDGLPVTMSAGETIATGDDGTLSYSGSIYRFVHPQLEAIMQPSRNMRVDVTVANDSTYGGHLGIADGNPANDAVVRDLDTEPALWTSYPLATMLEHGDELFEVAESWRITDPFDSPFSITSDVFDAVNPPRPGTEILEPFREQARQLLGALTSICDSDSAAGSYDVDLFAIEISIGNDPIPATCDYVFRGRVVTDPLGLRVPAATVVVDAPGLEPCTTTTDAAGAFHCDLVPDLAELDAAPATFPLPYTIEVTPAGAPAVAGTASGDVATAAAFGGGRLVEVGNVTVPVDTTKAVQLTGTLRELGELLETSTRFDVQVEGASPVANTVFVESGADGTYTTAFAVPLDATSVEVAWRHGVVGDLLPSATFDDLVAGVNDREFNAEYAPVELTVSGTALYNGEPLDQVDVLLEATRADGSQVFQRYQPTPDPSSGEYAFVAYLPVVTALVRLTTRVGAGANDVIELTHTPPVVGTDAVTFDIDLDAPVLDITGTARRNGVIPLTAPIQIDWDTDTGSGVAIRVVPVNQTNGEFDLVVDLPADATSASVRALTGVVREDDPIVDVTTLTPGRNPVVLDAQFVTPVLNVAGTVLGGSVGSVDPFFLATETPGGYRIRQRIQPNPDGTYDARVEVPAGTTDATVIAEVGFDSGDWATATPTGLLDGPNAVPLDAAFDAVGVEVTGTIRRDGQPVVGAVTLNVSARDGGAEVLNRNIVVTGDANGVYSTSIILPPGVDEMGVFAVLGSFSTLRPEVTVTGLQDGPNQRVIDDEVITRTIEVTGVFTSPPDFFAGLFTMVADQTLTFADGSTGTRQTRVSTVASSTDGTYRAVFLVPEIATEVDLTAELSAAPGGELQLLDVALVDGVNAVTFNGAVDLAVDLELRGLLVDADGPFEGTTQIRYVTRDSLGFVVGEETVEVTTSAIGEFVLIAELPNTVRSIDVAWLVGVDGEAPAFRRFDGLFPGRNVRVFSDLYDPPVVQLSGVATRNGDPITEPLTVEIAVTNGATTTEQVTPDAGTGAYTLSRTLERDADEVTVTISSSDPEDPTATITEAVGNGSNSIELDLVSLRTALTIAGEMRLGSTPPAGLVDLRITVSGAGQPDLVLDQQVDPDDADGSYGVGPFLLPLWAESVAVVAEIGNDPAIWPSTTFDALLLGDDAREFDAVVAPTIVDVGGTIQVGGVDVETGDLDVQLEWLDASDDVLSTEDLQPVIALGNWSIEDRQAPTGAVALRATATVDVPGTDPIVTTFDPLAEDLVFDLVWTPTEVTVNGAVVFGDDGANGDVRIQIIVNAAGEVRITEASSDETIPVGTDGAWTRTFSTFREIDEIIVRSYPIPATSFVSQTRTFTSAEITPGSANTLEVVADFDHRAVRVEGLLQRENVPVTASERLNVRVYRQGQPNPFTTTAETGDHAADGSYRSDRLLLLPTDTERIEVGWSLIDENLSNDEIWQSYDVSEVGRGVTEVEFDDNHIAKRVDLFGTLEVDDDPVVGDLPLRVTWTQRFDNGVFPQTRQYDFEDALDADGNYRIELVGPRNADIVLVEWRNGVSFEDFPETSLEPLLPGVNSLPFDANYITTQLRLMGTVQDRGVAPAAESISVEAWDAGGRSLGGRSIALGSTFTPGTYDPSTGAYDVLVDIPSQSAELRLTLRFNGPFDPYRNFVKTIATTPGTVNEDTFDARATSVLLSGLVTSDGTPLADTAVELGIEASDGAATPNVLVNLTEEVLTDASGRYSTLVYLPSGTGQITVTSDVGGAAPVVDTTIQSPGDVAVTADFDGDPTTGGVVLDGFLTVDGIAAPFNPIVTIVTFDDEGDIFSGPILTELDRISTNYVYGFDGSFDVASAVDVETDFVQVIVEFVGAPDVPYIRTFDVRGQALPHEFTLVIDDSPSALQYSGTSEVIDEDGGDAFDCDIGGLPFVFDLIVSARPTGGSFTEVGRSVMLTDDNGPTGFEFFPFNVALPVDTNELQFEVSTSNYYDFDLVTAEYAFVYTDTDAFTPVVPGGLTSIDDYITGDCEPFGSFE